MPENKNRFHEIYSVFHSSIIFSRNMSTVIEAFEGVLPLWCADSAAFMRLQQGCGGALSMHELVDLAPKQLWQRYRQKGRLNKDPLLRALRLCPHPIALSDLQRHEHLRRRSVFIGELFGEFGFGDVLALPILDRLGNLNVVLIAGADLRVGPTSRHQMTRIATETVLRLQKLNDVWETSLELSQVPRLTERQLEIANWLVAGKSDWEIGEILRLSPKTVNYHVEKMKRAYGVRSRNQFVAAIVRDGGIAPPSL